MRRILWIGILVFAACDDTIPGLCNVDGDCAGIEADAFCYKGVCVVPEDGGSGDGGVALGDDGGHVDAGGRNGGEDAGIDAVDGGALIDAGTGDDSGGSSSSGDAGFDGGPRDADPLDGGTPPTGNDAGVDAGALDSGLVLGMPCTASPQCGSGHCADGVCCDSECNDRICQRCDGASIGGAGYCGIAKAGTNLDSECSLPTSVCSGKCKMLKTTSACTGTSYSCASHQETEPVPSGQVCSANVSVPVSKDDYCSSGNDCAEGKCAAWKWWSSCSGEGACRAANDATDAYKEQVLASFGHSLTGACGTNGVSSCGNSCSGDALLLELCDGMGSCTKASSAEADDCSPYACDATTSRCRLECDSQSDCAQYYLCTNHTCHWDQEWAAWSLSPQAPVRFQVGSDGTTRDELTGLVWQFGISSTQVSWADAKAYCTNPPSLPGKGWRLPAAIELLSIVDPGKSHPAMDTTAFLPPLSGGELFWTSSPRADALEFVWCVDFLTGGLTSETVLYSEGDMPEPAPRLYWARCVR